VASGVGTFVSAGVKRPASDGGSAVTSLAGFEVTTIGRIWVTAEGLRRQNFGLEHLAQRHRSQTSKIYFSATNPLKINSFHPCDPDDLSPDRPRLSLASEQFNAIAARRLPVKLDRAPFRQAGNLPASIFASKILSR